MEDVLPLSDFLLEENFWTVPRDDGFISEKTQEALQVLSALQRGLERSEPEDSIHSAIPNREMFEIEESIGLIAFDSRRLRDALAMVGQTIRRIERNDSANAQFEYYGMLSIYQGRASFFRGYVDRHLNVPIVRSRDPGVIHFLAKIPNVGDKLKRENHAHFGIHYHYLNSSEERSDTILCFQLGTDWPLFSEKQAVKSSEFPARPGGWSAKKRKSVYGVLKPETRRFPAKEFRPPSTDAAIVWKTGANKIEDL
jgi:hypothetical protein